MRLDDIRNIAVIGAGIMGHGIAQSFLMGGYPVQLYDIREDILETAKSHIKKNLETFSDAGLIREAEVGPALGRLSGASDLKTAVTESDFVIEAAPENLDLKQGLFAQLEGLCRPETIIASNSSSLTITSIGRMVKNKDRLLIAHWFNPPHLVPTVELVKGEGTSDETLDTVYLLMEKIRKVPVKIYKEVPGFLVNRIQVALAREVLDLYEQGVASAEDIDKAVKGSIGFRLASIGPLLTMDLGGIKLWLTVYEHLIKEIQSSTEPPKPLQRLASEGHDGIKSGKGFYDYSVDFSSGGLDEIARKRDSEFLRRLKNLYWDAAGAFTPE